MPNASAGLLMYRRSPAVEVLLVHPGGPFWANKDAGAWTIPKGVIGDGEDEWDAAKREFAEETGLAPPADRAAYLDLGAVKQRAGKVVRAWAFEGNADPGALRSNTTTVQWPPGSGKRITIPEVDRAGWFSPLEATRKINPGQAELIDRLVSGLEACG